MFGYNTKKFAVTWIVVLLVLVIGVSAGLGHDSITGSLDLFAGFSALGDLFGGLPSLGGLLVVLIALAIVVWGLHYMSKTNYDGKEGARWAHIVIGVIVLVVAGFVGFRWINFDGDFWPTVGLLIGVIVLVTVASLIISRPSKKVVVEKETIATAS